MRFRDAATALLILVAVPAVVASAPGGGPNPGGSGEVQLLLNAIAPYGTVTQVLVHRSITLGELRAATQQAGVGGSAPDTNIVLVGVFQGSFRRGVLPGRANHNVPESTALLAVDPSTQSLLIYQTPAPTGNI